MKPSAALDANREFVRRAALAHRLHNPRVFGSALRGDDTDESDLDLLVDPSDDTSLLDIARLQVELEARLRVAVDVVTPAALPEKFRARVLLEARPV